MRIKEIHVDGFGAWTGLSIEGLSDQLTVFYGPNEAGKTTLMQFIRGVLYGFGAERRKRYLPPVNGGQWGGALLADSNQGQLRLTRRAAQGEANDSLGALTVSDPAGGQRSAATLNQLLAGVDEATFKNVFAVGLRELQELNALDATEASQLLYNLTTGLDRVALMEVMGELQEGRSRILGENAAASELETLMSQRARLAGEVDEIERRNRSWFDTIDELTVARQDIAAVERANDQLEAEIRSIDAALPIRVRWDDRELLRSQLEAGDQRIRITPQAMEQLEETKRQITAARKKRRDLKQQRVKIKKEAERLPANRRLLDHAARIEAIVEQQPWMEALEQQVRQMQPELGVPPGQPLGLMTTFATKPSSSPPANAPSEPMVTSRVLTSLRGPARMVREASRKLKEAQTELQSSREHVEKCSDRLELELVERGEPSLNRALEKAGSNVSRLRRRIQLEERLDKMTRHRNELEDDIEVLLDEQVLPLSALMWPAALSIIGFAMLLTGIVYEELLRLGIPVGLLGGVAVVAGILWKLNLERQSAQELESCNRQLRSLNDQIREAQNEREEVDRLLPQGGGSLDARLAAAETDLDHLQSLVPLNADRQVADHRGSGAERKVEQAEAALKDTRDRWRNCLRRFKLPENLKPSEIRELADQTEEHLMAEREQENRRRELEARERELLGFWGRIEQLLTDVRLKPADDDPRQRIEQLDNALKEQRKLRKRRGAMAAKHKQLGAELRSLNRQGRKLSQRLRNIFAEMGVTDESQLKELDERKRQASQTALQIEEETARIDIELEAHGAARDAIGMLVESCTRDELESRRKKLQSQLETGQAELGQLHQRQGALEQEVRSAGDDRRQDRLRLEIASLDRRLEDLVRQWRVTNVASHVLQKLRHDYENERQPATLSEASKYLEQLTEGRYRRIWTPFGEAALRIDNEDGQSLPLDVLSAGTREAVFVCLRLALAANFAQRGAGLPLVLDDVLVNFDVTRADAAAAVLCDFARRGHQMLLFTCHEHIMEAFEAAGVEIRVLPGRGAELLAERRRRRQEQVAALTPPPLPAPEPEVVPEEVVPEEAVEETVEAPAVVETPAPPVEEVVEVQAPAEPQVLLVLPDEEQDDIDEEMEDELLGPPPPVQAEPEEAEPAEPEEARGNWSVFWFEDDAWEDFAPPADVASPDNEPEEPVWEAAEMWWGDEAPQRTAMPG